MTPKRYDELVQKYLHNEISLEEAKELLDYLLKSMNEIIILAKSFKGFKIMDVDEK